MLKDLFPQSHGRYTALPLLGPVLDDFATWLLEHGYRRGTVWVMLRPVGCVDRWLRRLGVRRLSEISAERVQACWAALHQRESNLGGLVHALGRYLNVQGFLQPEPPHPLAPAQRQLLAYAEHLKQLRGLSRSTVCNHLRTAAQFLEHLAHDAEPCRLGLLTASDLESFIRARARQLRRGSLQQLVAQLRGFLRFLATHGEIRWGLETQIDTPRIYRQEQLPRALPWETVRALLQSIDRTKPVGLRDYTMLLLVATYGLRISEIAALTLDDICWREGWLRVPRPKVGTSLVLPLTNNAGTVLLRYLRKGRPTAARFRELFLRSRAPIGPLTPSAVSMVFDRWAERSGLEIPFHGAHCLRHSHAVHLLRGGSTLKTIGDLLGHRSAESTRVYLRLACEDLREVALSLPAAGTGRETGAGS